MHKRTVVRQQQCNLLQKNKDDLQCIKKAVSSSNEEVLNFGIPSLWLLPWIPHPSSSALPEFLQTPPESF